jgi:hypothetical protein
MGLILCVLFNVIHHLGDDFGDKSLSMEKQKDEGGIVIFIIKRISSLQMGFCWKGDRNCAF